MHIRHSNNQDKHLIQQVHLAAFPPEERETIAKLSADLLTGQSDPETISLVAELDGAIVGNIIFSPVSINAQIKAYILSPLGVVPEAQRHKIGSKLIEVGLQQLRETGTQLVFVYGDPAYYGRFGFSATVALSYPAPFPLEFSFGWQALALRECGAEQGPIALSCVPALSDPALW